MIRRRTRRIHLLLVSIKTLFGFLLVLGCEAFSTTPKVLRPTPIRTSLPITTVAKANANTSTSTGKNNDDDVDDDFDDVTYFIFPGGGIFFAWQAGVMTYLKQHDYDLSDSSCRFLGSSAGSLMATMSALNVDLEEALQTALDLAANKYDVWDRPKGLQGVLLDMIDEWLQIMIPQDAATSMVEDDNGNRLSILVTPVPFLWQKQTLRSFSCRQDLIDCNLASIFLPFFSNGDLFYTIPNRGIYIDGNFLSTGRHYLPPKKRQKKNQLIVLNWQKDSNLKEKGLTEEDLVATLSPDTIWELVQIGKMYAQALEAKGKFQSIPKKN